MGEFLIKGVYSGIDVVYYGNQRQLEYDFVVTPGANPKDIRLKFDGADRLSTAANGDLVLHTQYGEFASESLSFIRMWMANAVLSRPATNVRDHRGFFQSGRIRPVKTIDYRSDPCLLYVLGGTGVENGNAVAVDSAQAVYVAGSTASDDFPVIAALNGQTSFRGGSYDAFVIKYAPAGNAILFATYIGGGGFDSATGIGVDSAGNIVVSGDTDSPGFPLKNPLQGIDRRARSMHSC